MDSTKDPAQFVHIKNVVEDLLKTYEKDSHHSLLNVRQVWESDLSPDIAFNSRPMAFKGNLLLVDVSNAAWMHDLYFLKKELIGRINDLLGNDLIGDIKFKIGEF